MNVTWKQLELVVSSFRPRWTHPSVLCGKFILDLTNMLVDFLSQNSTRHLTNSSVWPIIKSTCLSSISIDVIWVPNSLVELLTLKEQNVKSTTCPPSVNFHLPVKHKNPEKQTKSDQISNRHQRRLQSLCGGQNKTNVAASSQCSCVFWNQSVRWEDWSLSCLYDYLTLLPGRQQSYLGL